jgi:hypothetical protein
MIATDRILINPSRSALAAALAAAVTRINLNQTEGPYLLHVVSEADQLHDEMQLQREGSRTWRVPARGWRFSSEAELFAAWWTDFLGRKQLRLVGGHSQDGEPLPVPALNLPALACVYPCHVVLRDRNRRSELLVVCDCGAWGRPEEIAWMGTQCGPCFDRAEERAVQGRPVSRCEGGVRALAFSPDGKYLAMVNAQRTLLLWDLEEGRSVPGLEVQEVAGKVCFSPDGGLLGWGLEQGGHRTQLHRFRDGQRAVGEGYPYAFLGDGGIVLFDQGQLRFHSGLEDQLDLGLYFRTRHRTYRLPSALEVTDLAVSPDGRLLAANCGAQGLLFWDFRVGPPYVHTHVASATGPLVFSPDGTILAAKAERPMAEVSLWDVHVPAGRLRGLVGVHQTNSFAFTTDGTLLVTAEGQDTLRIWDVQTALERQALHLPAGDRLESMALSPCGRLLALGMASGAVRLWPAEILRVDG